MSRTAGSRRRPVCALAALSFVCLIRVLWWVPERFPKIGDGANGYAGLGIAVLLLLVSVALGMVAAALLVASLLRREPRLWLIPPLIAGFLLAAWVA